MPAIIILIALIYLRSINTNRAYTPIINQLSNKQALYLTTITTATSTVLLPKRTFAALPIVP
jgi:hypothetical protein